MTCPTGSQGEPCAPASPLPTPRAKYPLGPLAAAAGVPLASLGRVLGMSGSTWQNARDDGVGEKAADRYAVRLGLHPFTVWPEMAEHHIADTRRKYNARKAELERKRYQRSPQRREQALENSRRYYAECRDYILACKVEYRRANAVQIAARRRERYATDPEYRERLLARQRETRKSRSEAA